jgi:hypothetical protein
MGKRSRSLTRNHRRIITPGTVGGCFLWLDAEKGLYDSVTGGSLVTTNGATIARWEDQGPLKNHFSQATAGSRPTLLNNAFNGKKGVSFLSKFMRIASDTTVGDWGTQNNLFIYAVFKFNSSSTASYENIIMRSGGYSGTVAGVWGLRKWDLTPYSGSAGQLAGVAFTNGYYDRTGQSNFNSTSYNLIFYSFPREDTRNFNVSMQVNNVLQQSLSIGDNAANLVTNHKLILGTSQYGTGYTVDASTYFNGVLCELVVYLRPNKLVEYEFIGLRSYFKAKYGIA